MAAAFLNKLASPTKAVGLSAGTQPSDRVHPAVATVMGEVGIDLSGAHPRLLTPELARQATVLVTMGCGEACPFVPGVEVQDWALPDPRDQPPDQVRAIRDEIGRRVTELVRSRNLA